MGEPLHNSVSRRNSEVPSKKVYKKNVVAPGPETFPQSAYRHLVSLSHGRNGSVVVGDAAIFLLKIAALEAVRRVSRCKFPSLWRGLQVLQVICYPPFKWIQRWAPFKGLIRGVQTFSRPLLVLSIATAFSDQSDHDCETSDGSNGSHSDSETNSVSLSTHSSPDTRNGDGDPQNVTSENWLMQLHKELENQAITLPERINEDELNRFYTAANGDFSCLLVSIKKTIRWRDTYRLLSEQELHMWSDMVFWHGFDVEQRPCLIIRLGHACVNLPFTDRPRFAQAIISQVEDGILHFVDEDNPQITVLVDCDGLSPLKVPMQMMRSCSSILQDNFPNRLGHLLVIRLPPVVRVIAQTFIQVLKPVTRKKLRIEGNTYRRVLSEYLQTLPSYLGGSCTCKVCLDISTRVLRQPQSLNQIDNVETQEFLGEGEDVSMSHLTGQANTDMDEEWNQLLRTAVISLVMVLALIAFVAGMYDPESRPF